MALDSEETRAQKLGKMKPVIIVGVRPQKKAGSTRRDDGWVGQHERHGKHPAKKEERK